MSTLHITNGDSAAATLRTFLADPVTVTADVLHEGPAPAGLEGSEWYARRARHLAGHGYAPEEVRQGLSAWDRAITTAPQYDEVVLWFEHDLFDQLLLIRTLDMLVRLKPDAAPEHVAPDAAFDNVIPDTATERPTRDAAGGASGFSRTFTVSLICIDRFPGVDRFIGLGQLSAAQLSTLTGTRTPVTPEQYALAVDAWRAFRAADPAALVELTEGLLANGQAPLPFLGAALKRFLEEYPWTTNGLSRTATAALRALAGRPLDGGRLFMATQADEDRPFMGDSSFFGLIRHLAGARVPLVAIDPRDEAADLRGHTVSITDAGRRVLSGASDAVALNGIDEWRGGVHLVGPTSPLRWDPRRQRLVS